MGTVVMRVTEEGRVLDADEMCEVNDITVVQHCGPDRLADRRCYDLLEHTSDGNIVTLTRAQLVALLELVALVLLVLLGACGDNLSRPDGGGDAIMSVDASPPVPDAGCTAALCVGADAGACAIVCDVAGPAPSGWGCNARGECSCAPGGTPACTP